MKVVQCGLICGWCWSFGDLTPVVVVVKPFHPPDALMVVGEFKHNLCGRMQYEHRTNTASLYAEAL